MYGDDLVEVPTGKHSPYDEKYAHYDCIYTHVRNPHTRMLSMYLFHFELNHMPEKHIDKERWNFLDTEFRWKISKVFGSNWKDISDFDKLIMQKMKPLHSNISPDNYVKWLELHVKKIEDEEGEKLNQTSRMPEHNDDEYLEAGRSLIEQYYSEDLRRFGY